MVQVECKKCKLSTIKMEANDLRDAFLKRMEYISNGDEYSATTTKVA